MRLRRRVAPLVAMTTMAAMAGIGLIGAPAALADDTVTIDILGINDFHGRLTANGQEAGAAALATAVKEMRAENPNTIFAAAGDLIGASTFTSFIQQDNPTIDALNAAGLEVSAVGNHEFDRGYDDLMNRVIPRARGSTSAPMSGSRRSSGTDIGSSPGPGSRRSTGSRSASSAR